MKIYTKKGDEGETSLLFGGRISKTDPRVIAYGTVDEAISAMGLARATARDGWVRGKLFEAQRDLFTVMSELASAPSEHDRFKKHFKAITPERTAALEALIDYVDARIKLPPSFVIPGASAGSAAIDLARAVVRRAERDIIALGQVSQLMNPEIVRYLNRCSDALFMLARYEDRELSPELVTGTRVERGKADTP
ncbi:MAG: cob(I)yrinic acid a,c-diamide adenosyltransferase [SAR202 cluster bacterium]|nr:cob(I)yrinic acid a,c-diamide adenosyltransferase [SAR202 cluster bacterium]